MDIENEEGKKIQVKTDFVPNVELKSKKVKNFVPNVEIS